MSKMNTRDLTGMFFGRWEVLYQTEDNVTPKGAHQPMWVCRCTCENQTIKVVNAYSLWRGDTTSCGCLSKDPEANPHRTHNEYRKMKGYYVGYDHNGAKFYIDEDKYSEVKKWKWYVDDHGYVRTIVNYRKIYLHRFVFGEENVPDGCYIDHINTHNRTDCRLRNLRIANKSQNVINQAVKSNNTSGVTGVYKANRTGKWYAKITVSKKVLNLGTFTNFEDAVKARKEAERRYFGEYSYDASQKIAKERAVI